VFTPSSDSGGSGLTNAQRFAQTQWSVVLSAAKRRDDAGAEQAMEELCRIYWTPLYAFTRRSGENPHDAQDLTQEFFARLLQKDFLGSVGKSKGRFRSFLLASLKHFLSNQRDWNRAQKRGGGRAPLPLDAGAAETGIGFQAADDLTPEKAFQKRWALTLLELTLARLREEHVERGSLEMFEHLKGTLTEGRGNVPYAELAARMGTSEAAVKMAVMRLRRRYREILRAEIARTVGDESEVEDELRDVFRALSY